eukprot:TRINITY_DN1725_c0_g1_i2.p1 TRINITY_DN1725_c0_g1~~TRINITY_DN1725_c0_g1_i2.p1  ORF type:complete len:332 (-),score=36.10 TRINITY_DN1725_c0_g1_i2:318-1313(-)
MKAQSVLQWLLGETLSVERFFSEAWETTPVLINTSDDASNRFAEIFGFTELEEALERVPLIQQAEQLVFKDLQQSGNYRTPFHAYLDGGSVVVNHLDKLWGGVNKLCRDLRQNFPHVYANMYLTPAGSQTAPVHSDDRDVLILQLWGTKEWHIFGSPVAFPYSYEQLGKGGAEVPAATLRQPLLEGTLRTGGVLYIPRGFVHYAAATSDPSLHLTLAIPTHDWTWGRLIADAVSKAEGVGEQIRRCVPLDLPSLSPEDLEKQRDAYTAALRQVLENVTLEATQAHFVRKLSRHNGQQDVAVPEIALQRITLDTVMRRHPFTRLFEIKVTTM